MTNIPKPIERVLIVTINGKGGVGKTFITTLVAMWLSYHRLLQILLDCDDNQSLSKLMPQAERHNLKPSDGIEKLIAQILKKEIGVADFPANITAELVDLFASTEFGPSLDSISSRLVILVPIVANDLVALDEVRRMVAAVKSAATYIVVKNERDGVDFTAFDNSPAGQYLKSLGTPEIRIPKLKANLQQLLNTDRLTLTQFVGRYWSMRETDPKAAFPQTIPAQAAISTLRHIFVQLYGISSLFLPTAVAEKIRVETDDEPDELRTFCLNSWATKHKTQNVT